MYLFWMVSGLAAVAYTPEDCENRLTTQITQARRTTDRPLENMSTMVNYVGEGSEIDVVPL